MEGRLLLALLLVPLVSAAAPVQISPPTWRPPRSMPLLPTARPRASSESEALAAALRVRLRRLEAALAGAMDQLAVDSLGLSSCARLSELKEMGATGLPAGDCAAKRREVAARYHAAIESFGVEASIIVVRLEAYRQTGVLPPPKPFDRRIFSFDQLTDPDAVLDIKPHPVPGMELSLDLAQLRKQLERFQGGPIPVRPNPPALPPPSLAARRRPVVPPFAPLFQRVAGRGASRADPFPELVAQLSDAESRRRALAADELGQAGASSKPALALLLKAAADPFSRVRASAVLALSRIAPDEEVVMSAVRRAAADPSEDVRYAAGLVLEQLPRRAGSR